MKRFVGDRAAEIDHAFDIGISLGATASTWHAPEQADPRRIFLTFRVVHTVGWVNLTPALELLKAEHEFLAAVFYHWLRNGLSRWFRVFDAQEARWRWESWVEMREQDEAERREECEREGIPYEPGETLGEPMLPECIAKMPCGNRHDAHKLVRSVQSRRLLEAAERLNRVSRPERCPRLDSADREDLFPDSDAPIPLLALAFGEHDVITEFLNMELHRSEIDPPGIPLCQSGDRDTRSRRADARLCPGL
jgi:hypothetical protein